MDVKYYIYALVCMVLIFCVLMSIAYIKSKYAEYRGYDYKKEKWNE